VHAITGEVHLGCLFEEGWHTDRNLHDIIFGFARIFAEPEKLLMGKTEFQNLEAAQILHKSEKEFGEVVEKTLRGGPVAVGGDSVKFEKFI